MAGRGYSRPACEGSLGCAGAARRLVAVGSSRPSDSAGSASELSRSEGAHSAGSATVRAALRADRYRATASPRGRE